MWKVILAGTTALPVIGASLVYAQQTAPTQPEQDTAQQRPRISPEDRAAFTDARIAGLRAGLKLTPAQERLWPPVELALRDRAKLRADRFDRFLKMREERRQQSDTQRREQRQDAFIDRMKSRADDMAASAASMKKLADAIDPLYKSLDDSQKQRFAVLFRTDGGRLPFHRRWFRGRDGGLDRDMDRQGPGPRQRRTNLDL